MSTEKPEATSIEPQPVPLPAASVSTASAPTASASTSTSTSTPPAPTLKPKRHRIFEFPSSFWQTATTTTGNDVPTAPPEGTTKPNNTEGGVSSPSVCATAPRQPNVSEKAQCTTCDITHFDTLLEQRDHFRTDWHKYNLQRRVRSIASVTQVQFDALSDLGSHSSLSGTDTDNNSDTDSESTYSDTDDVHAKPHAQSTGATTTSTTTSATTTSVVKTPLRHAERIEFHNPALSDAPYVIAYKCALPDQRTLASLADCGAWAVVMTGGGHFSAAVWNAQGMPVCHKTFHRYTSRKKQGGSQAAADEARGGGSRIKSAGATLRRYGEQALEQEVHELLISWRAELSSAQCIFIRASQREKKTLLFGWEGSPLKQAQNEDRVRTIPIPTRRATFKEAQRVYDELSTVVISPTSLLEAALAKTKAAASTKPKEMLPTPRAKSATSTARKEKGTDHLKKRDDKAKPPLPPPPVAETDEVEEAPVLDERLVRLARACIDADHACLSTMFEDDGGNCRDATFSRAYFPAGDSRFDKIGDDAVSLLGIAALSGNSNMVTWLLDNGVSPTTGASPYLLTKSKPVRNAMRTYWGTHPDKYAYADAGIPSPLTQADLEAVAQKEKQKRQKEKQRKKEKALEKIEAAKSPAQKARELRAAAAEARLLGNRCAGCQKGLDGLVAFERLSYKYCSTDCVTKHRRQLSLS